MSRLKLISTICLTVAIFIGWTFGGHLSAVDATDLLVTFLVALVIGYIFIGILWVIPKFRKTPTTCYAVGIAFALGYTLIILNGERIALGHIKATTIFGGLFAIAIFYRRIRIINYRVYVSQNNRLGVDQVDDAERITLKKITVELKKQEQNSQEILRRNLLRSFQYRAIENAKCVLCGCSDTNFALHVIEYYHSDEILSPPCFIPMSISHGTTRGSIPICSNCCQPCRACSLPIATPWIGKMMKNIELRYSRVRAVAGRGICMHVHPVRDLISLFRNKNLPELKCEESSTSTRPPVFDPSIDEDESLVEGMAIARQMLAKRDAAQKVTFSEVERKHYSLIGETPERIQQYWDDGYRVLKMDEPLFFDPSIAETKFMASGMAKLRQMLVERNAAESNKDVF